MNHLRAYLVGALLVAVGASGCANGKDKDDDGTSGTDTRTSTGGGSGTGTSTGSNTGTGTGGPGGNDTPNSPPVASIVASIGNGSPPLMVHFNISATDADGDNLTWSMDFGDNATENGTTLPTMVMHTYNETGNYTAELNVTDGKDFTLRNVTIKVNATGGAGQVANLAWEAGGSDIGAIPDVFTCEDGPGIGVTHDAFTIESPTVGLPFEATITAAAGGPTLVGWGILVNLKDCSDFADTFTAEGAAAITGTIPANSGYTVVYSDGGADLTVQYKSGSQIG